MALSKQVVYDVQNLFRSNWPNGDYSVGRSQMFEMHLAHLGDDLFYHAALYCLAHCTFQPNIADMLKAAATLVKDAAGVPDAMAAWQEVKRNVTAVSAHRKWSHPLVKKALDRLGGLDAFGRSSENAEPTWRARYLEAYNGLVTALMNQFGEPPALQAWRAERQLEAGEKVLLLENSV
jgi:hypothetical protein